MEISSCLKNHCLGLLLALVAMLCLLTADAQTGACYGTLGNNLPPPSEIIALCKQYNIRRIRIYNPNPSILQALQGSNISVLVGVANEDIQGIASDPALATFWVRNNVLKYRNVDFRYISVGNEISPAKGDPSAGIAPSVPVAMQRISDALAVAGLRRVRVTTALFSLGVLANSNPPSAGEFKPDFRESFIDPIIEFLKRTNSPLLVNMYPYYAYVSNTTGIRLDYALFMSKSIVVRDGGYEYQNLFDALLDAVHVALEKAGGGDVEVVVAGTGWPSAGGTATTLANARAYNSHLLKSVKRGTPRKPWKPIEAYIFDLIDENMKSPEYEKHWGIFLTNKQPKYPLSFA